MAIQLGSSQKARDYFIDYPDEARFMRYFGEVFEITSADRWSTNFSDYSYYFLRAFPKPAVRYGLTSEILVLYASYPEVQARSLNDIAQLQDNFKDRVHPVWNILITDDTETVQHIEELVIGKDWEVYSIPFSRAELESKPEASFIYKRLEQYMRSRDLFDFQSGLQSDRFFFGRKSLVDDIVGRVENGQNFGLFGLRKMGKTSVLFAVERYLNRLSSFRTIHIDCQLADFYLLTWNALISWITEKILDHKVAPISDYSLQGKLLNQAVEQCDCNILLVFDEVENISFDIAPSRHWDKDFLHFWGTIRAVHQMTGGKLTFGVSGVNPHIFNTPLVAGHDNPILLGGSPLYLWPLKEIAVRDMVRTIGRYMGLSFEDEVYSWLYKQYGGHPYLIRRACSLVCQKASKSSGDTVRIDEFTSRRNWLDDQLGNDVMKILVVLVHHYPDEFEHLMMLAEGEYDWIQYVYEEEKGSLEHLIDYHIIRQQEGEFEIVLDTLRRFLTTFGKPLVEAVQAMTKSNTPTAYDKLPNPEQLELWTRVSQARNSVEPCLRILLHRALLFKYGDQKALNLTLSKFSQKKRESLAGHNLAAIFSGESKMLYLKDLKEIALREWDLIKHAFGNDRKKFELQLDRLNTIGRADTHANPIAEQEVLEVEALARELLHSMSPYIA